MAVSGLTHHAVGYSALDRQMLAAIAFISVFYEVLFFIT